MNNQLVLSRWSILRGGWAFLYSGLERRFLSLASAALLLAASPASATTITLNPLSSSASVGDAVTVELSISGVGAPGVISIHADLWYDTSVLSLSSATAGGFFDANYGAGAGSIWTDGFDLELLTGDAVDITSTNLTTQPDIFGIDIFESNLVPSMTDGLLVTLIFDAVGAGSAGLSLNDVSVFDDDFNEFTSGSVLSDVTVSAVPEPGMLLLLGLGGIVFGWTQRRLARGSNISLV